MSEWYDESLDRLRTAARLSEQYYKKPLVALLMELCCEAWIAASNRFRDVCGGESLIREYRKHKAEFRLWLEEKKNGG